tara:strand:- start:550 stop:705 length:156 start_codon:yes stop_codon:yes gene_type:complete
VNFDENTHPPILTVLTRKSEYLQKTGFFSIGKNTLLLFFWSKMLKTAYNWK